ncbi:FG-GAP-like repeat-containing protein [Negadavirga shengliensis]|uniref:FG-GAP-like repeat-containing protein n=1 Tax=Negadavirga shengliensis TaxID=1389218 RepID=A0ABV9T7F6_9BACT
MRNVLLLLIMWLIVFEIFAQRQFTDVTEEAGIDHYFEVFQGIFGGGVAVLDYNNDGWEDVFITGGLGKDALYRNNGDGTFTNIIDEAGFSELKNVVTQGVVCADVNKDGFVDIFITTIAAIEGDQFTASANFLFINTGAGKFTNKTKSYGLDQVTFSTGAAFGDVNNDGFPDLYVSNFFNRFSGRLDDYLGVIAEGDRAPAVDLLYINNGGGSFTESGAHYGMTHTGFGFGGVFTDFDNDGDLDLMVINDFGYQATPNLLYRNEYPDNTFTDISKKMGFDQAINAMGIGIGDYNLDGWLDYFISNISTSPFLENQGKKDMPFVEKTRQIGTSHPILFTEEGQEVVAISWGANFFDYDNDMDLDLFVANGCLNPSVLPNPNVILENFNGQFVLNGPSMGLSDPSIGRGSVTFDFDNDGNLDLLVVNQTQIPPGDETFENRSVRLYRNEGFGNNWLKVKLYGEMADKNGIGSRIEAYVNGKKLIREIDGGSSHISQNSTIAHFGLAQAAVVDSLIVRWMGGGEEKRYGLDANQQLDIYQEALVTGIPEHTVAAKVTVFPNPAQNLINIQVGQMNVANGVELEIFNAMGKSVAKSGVNKENVTYQIISYELPVLLEPGIYLLKITTGTSVVSIKFMKE